MLQFAVLPDPHQKFQATAKPQLTPFQVAEDNMSVDCLGHTDTSTPDPDKILSEQNIDMIFVLSLSISQ